MKFTTIYVGDNKVEVFNSMLGKETIKVNDEIVSSKYSITGSEHEFVVIENGEEAQCKVITGFGFNGVVIDFYKNDKPIIESPRGGCGWFLLGIVGVVLGIRLIEDLF